MRQPAPSEELFEGDSIRGLLTTRHADSEGFQGFSKLDMA